MRYQVDIQEDGKMVTEVLDRRNHVCSDIKQITNAVGTEESDEHLDDESDKVNEISFD